MTSQATREFMALVLCLFAFVMIFGHCIGCGASREAKEAAAEAAYGAEHLRCVDKYDTREAIDACREDVRRRWGIATTSADAGADR
jgi:hypothetical protein